MDLCSIHVKNKGAFCVSNPILNSPITTRNLKCTIGASYVNLRFLEIRISEAKPFKNQSFVVGALGKKKNNGSNDSDNSDPSSSKGNGNRSNGEGDSKKDNSPSEKNKSNETGSQNSHPKLLDWREFRASLYIQEQAESAVSDSHNQDQEVSSVPKSLPKKWAHPISVPENGCLLVASEKLDGIHPFERTVILLLRAGTRHPQEGPFGIIINRPHNRRIKHLKPINLDLQTTFGECSVHLGGPLEASTFLLRSNENPKLLGIEEVLPGLYFGARNSLDSASTLVKKGALKLQDFRFFIGYAGWQLDQLRDEIDCGFWCVAACSANLIFGSSQNSAAPGGLWKETLQLMGGHYSELSRKPKQDI